MSDNGKLLYYSAKAGDAEQLQILIQKVLLQEYQQGQQGLQTLSLTDQLEYVDDKTGFTPLVAAVHWHRLQAARTLLEHGADVHSHSANISQTPLRLAVDDVNLNSKMVELLVAYGASPFLEARDGQSPLDRVVNLRQSRIGPMPNPLGSVLLCLRRRCAFRGHLELKVDRYMGLSQTWRKFFCVLAPRERVAGYALEMQLLVFSKNGFDPVTSILTTDAAPIQIPLKAAHGRACFELALSHRQTKKPLRLFAPGDVRQGYSIYVRALSKNPVEAKWLHRFVDLATSDPNLAMLNGDSEVQVPVRFSAADQAALAAKHLQHQDTNGSTSKPRSASFSSFSDSAHVFNIHRPQPSEVADDSSEGHSRLNGFSASDSVRSSPIRAPPPPLNPLHSVPVLASDRSVTIVPNQAILTQPVPVCNLQPQPESSASTWRSNAVYEGGKQIQCASAYRASQSLPSDKSFMPVDRQLTAHWRAKALEGLDDRSSVDSGGSTRHQLPVVTEGEPEELLPALLERLDQEHQAAQILPIPPQQQLQPQPQRHEQQAQLEQQAAAVYAAPILAQQPIIMPDQLQPADTPSQLAPEPLPKLSDNPVFSPVPEESPAPEIVPASRYVPAPPNRETVRFVGPPASRAIHTTNHPSSTKSSLSRYVSTDHDGLMQNQHAQLSPLPPQSLLHSPEQLPRQQQQVGIVHQSAQPHADDFEELDLAAEHQAVDDFPSELDQMYPLHPPVQPSLPSLLIESNLEAVKARSTLLDIPSAELLDSILDFANAVEQQQHESMSSCETGVPEPRAEGGSKGHPWDSSHEMQTQVRAAKRQATPYSTMSRTSAASSVEPFSDDDDVTILDTTEVKKLSPQPLQALPEGPLPDALPQPRPDRHVRQGVSHALEQQQHVVRDSEPLQQPFHHYTLSPQLIESGSPGAAARYGHLNRMYDTSNSDLSSQTAHTANQHHSQHSPPRPDGQLYPVGVKQSAAQPGMGFQHHNSIYDSSGSQQHEGHQGSASLATEQQHFFDIIEDAGLAPQMRPGEFREMIDGIMAMSEKQAQAQMHSSGGAASLRPIWENEELQHQH